MCHPAQCGGSAKLCWRTPCDPPSFHQRRHPSSAPCPEAQVGPRARGPLSGDQAGAQTKDWPECPARMQPETPSVQPPFAIVHAYRGDTLRNLAHSHLRPALRHFDELRSSSTEGRIHNRVHSRMRSRHNKPLMPEEKSVPPHRPFTLPEIYPQPPARMIEAAHTTCHSRCQPDEEKPSSRPRCPERGMTETVSPLHPAGAPAGTNTRALAPAI